MKKSRYTRYFKYPLDCLIAAFSDIIDLSCPIVNHLVTCHSQQGLAAIFSFRNVRERTENIQDHQV